MADEAQTEETTDAIDPEVKKLVTKLEKLVRNNVAIEQDLIKQRVQPNPFVILTMRLNLLLDLLMGQGEARLKYEISSAEHVHSILMQIQQDTAKNKLIIPELRPV
jgi:hypothetical protein